MTDKTAVAVQSMKAAQVEMVQWENRLEALRNEHGNLTRQRDQLQQEIDQKRADYQNYIAARDKQLKDDTVTLSEGKKALEAQWNEFKDILNHHNIEKNNLQQERLSFEKEKSAFSGRQKSVSDFIQTVRRAYNVLPEE